MDPYESECDTYGHDWQRDPQGSDEGLICATCGVTEAELDHIERRGGHR